MPSNDIDSNARGHHPNDVHRMVVSHSPWVVSYYTVDVVGAHTRMMMAKIVVIGRSLDTTNMDIGYDTNTWNRRVTDTLTNFVNYYRVVLTGMIVIHH